MDREIMISEKEYQRMCKEIKRLERQVSFLSCLEAVGVDNWNGYDYAHEMFEEEHGEEYF